MLSRSLRLSENQESISLRLNRLHPQPVQFCLGRERAFQKAVFQDLHLTLGFLFELLWGEVWVRMVCAAVARGSKGKLVFGGIRW